MLFAREGTITGWARSRGPLILGLLEFEQGTRFLRDGVAWDVVQRGSDAAAVCNVETGNVVSLLYDDLVRLYSSGVIAPSPQAAAADATLAARREAVMASASPNQVARARKRLALLDEAKRTWCAPEGVTARTIRNYAAWAREGEALYGDALLGLIRSSGRVRGRTPGLPAPQQRALEDVVEEFAHDVRAGRVAAAHRRLVALCNERNVVPAPSESTVRRALARRDTPSYTRARLGKRAGKQVRPPEPPGTLASPVGDRPFEVVYVDHTPLDVSLLSSSDGVAMPKSSRRTREGAIDLRRAGPAWEVLDGGIVELRECFERHAVTPEGIQFIEQICCSDPVRRVSSTPFSAATRYASRKMKRVVQSESHPELLYVYFCEHTDSVRLFLCQPRTVHLMVRDANRRRIPWRYTPDFFVFDAQSGFAMVECKTLDELRKDETAPSPRYVRDGSRWLFVTSNRVHPYSRNISHYNSTVQERARNGHEAIRVHSAGFRVLGSTQAVNARTNTCTRAADTDAPIYWVNGAKVADNYADLYDGSWDSNADRFENGTENGSDFRSDTEAYTGTNANGTTSSLYLGNNAPGFDPDVTVGDPEESAKELNSRGILRSNIRRLYGLSHTFLVQAGATTESLSVISTPSIGDTHRRGERMEVEVTYTAAVEVAGVPIMRLGLSTHDRTFLVLFEAPYLRGSGTNKLVFGWEVSPPPLCQH